MSDTEASYQQEELGDAAALGEVEHDVAMMAVEPESPVNYCSCSGPVDSEPSPAGPFAATRSLGATAGAYRSSGTGGQPMAQPPMELPPVRQNAHVRL